jgi:muconolactone delta-isomerase
VLSDEFMSLVPAQIEKINELMTQRVLSSYTLNADRSRLWATLDADSEMEAIEILRSFPIYDWMEYTIHELMFHQESSSFLIPRFSLN